MSEAEKQEGQKTVVAFITGLLIGGLLVWVFSSTPADAPVDESEEVTTEESANTDDSDQISIATDTTETIKAAVSGTGSLSINDQAAGDAVVLGTTTYPTESGWIVVRDFTDGNLGNILGAARYSLDEGLTPTAVRLLRNTETGSSYQVMFYSESGDKKFSTADDKAIDGGATTFKAN